jgi:hypothetical protein
MTKKKLQRKLKRDKTSSARKKNRAARVRKIKHVSTMKRSEFKRQPKGAPTESLVRWMWKQQIKTPCGKFGVELFTEDDDPIDDTMVRLAEELAQYAQAHSEYIREIIYGHYRFYVTEYGADSLFAEDLEVLRPDAPSVARTQGLLCRSALSMHYRCLSRMGTRAWFES